MYMYVSIYISAILYIRTQIMRTIEIVDATRWKCSSIVQKTPACLPGCLSRSRTWHLCNSYLNCHIKVLFNLVPCPCSDIVVCVYVCICTHISTIAGTYTQLQIQIQFEIKAHKRYAWPQFVII